MRAAVLSALALLTGAGAGEAAPVPPPPLLPMARAVAPCPGAFSLAGAAIRPSADSAGRAAAARLDELLGRAGLPRPAASSAGAIAFVRDGTVAGDEAYRLTIRPGGILVRARGAAGLYYGAETLWQLIAGQRGRPLACVTIDDAPRFSWRGVMLDSARHFQPATYVRQLIDRMAEVKLNVLHWHLADDQGWRLQIDRYPRLTSVGAWRTPAGDEQPRRYGGFYTKAEVRAVVAYAAAHHVTVVPEIDLPGHATAMIAAYPGLASIPSPATSPSHDWGILPNLINPTEANMGFVERVLDEVLALFPGRYIHLGGDEAVKDQWKANPAVQAQIRALGLKDEDALQSWFTARLGRYLAQHGRTLIGWDEILQGEVPPGAAITSWHGIDGAIAAARAGHDAVLAPAPIFYLDNRQSDAPDEPPGRGEIVDWRRLYDFDPAPAALTAEQRRHILGLQVNLWTEHVRTTGYADRMIWPRAAVLAELGWTPADARGWDGFAPRLLDAMARWRRLRWAYDQTPLAPALSVWPGSATLRQPAGIGTVRFTSDGRTPTAQSDAFVDGFIIVGPEPMTVTAEAFLGDRPVGPVRRWVVSLADARTRAAADLPLCDNAVPIRVEDDDATAGRRRVLWGDVVHPCWIWHRAPLEGVSAIRAEVGRVPYNFQDGAKPLRARFAHPQTAAGELVVHRDTCAGPEIARLPLGPILGKPGVNPVRGTVARLSGSADLCIEVAQADIDRMWLLDRLTLERAP